jgi:hypothetical protein
MARDHQPWGGEIRIPGWLRRLLRRPASAEDTPEAFHERRNPQQSEYAALEHMRAAGTLAPHDSELPGGNNYRRR